MHKILQASPSTPPKWSTMPTSGRALRYHHQTLQNSDCAVIRDPQAAYHPVVHIPVFVLPPPRWRVQGHPSAPGIPFSAPTGPPRPGRHQACR
ncbi:MAG: hypothetical protein WDW38_003891 [Sanguina aurantia]